MTHKGNSVFFAEGLAHLRTVGAVVCTSRFVARAMAPKIKQSDPHKVIVELGVGIGNLTQEIVKRLRPHDFFVGVDINEKFVGLCRKNIAYAHKGLSVRIEHASAEHIDDILERHHLREADEIVCTLPFRSLPKKDIARILEKVKKVLKKGGYFTFIRYMTAPENKDIFQLLDNFEVVERKIVMRNIPPAEVVKMRKG